MTRAFFLSQMKTLIEDFGAAEFTQNRMNMIWESCSDLPDRSFQNICRHFLQTKPIKYPPLPTHFIEEAQNQRKLLATGGLRLVRTETADPVNPSESLSRVLKSMGVSSLTDAVMRRVPSQNSNE